MYFIGQTIHLYDSSCSKREDRSRVSQQPGHGDAKTIRWFFSVLIETKHKGVYIRRTRRPKHMS